jgi:hypothetical protein
MYEGFARLGGTEIINNERSRQYAETEGCSITWMTGPRCETLADALGDDPYSTSGVAQAPWYDVEDERTHRFFGVYAVSIGGISDSTVTAEVTEGITAGGVIGARRDAVRYLKFRVLLTARGEDALEYGMSWLKSALTPRECGVHQQGCGTTDIEFFLSCPPAPEDEEADEDYEARVDRYYRGYHDVARNSGPLEERTFRRGESWGRFVNFIIACQNPYLLSRPKAITFEPTLPQVVDDTAYNMVPVPSAELPGPAVLVATNFSTNPSLELDAEGWLFDATAVSGDDPLPLTTDGVSTDMASVGAQSYRVRLLGNGAGGDSGTADLIAYQDVEIAYEAGLRVSCTMWAGVLVSQGLSVSDVQEISVDLQWLDGADADIGSPVNIGSVSSPGPTAPGETFVKRSIAVPATAVKARVSATATVDWASSATASLNSDIRLYCDALGVIVP